MIKPGKPQRRQETNDSTANLSSQKKCKLKLDKMSLHTHQTGKNVKVWQDQVLARLWAKCLYAGDALLIQSFWRAWPHLVNYSWKPATYVILFLLDGINHRETLIKMPMHTSPRTATGPLFVILQNCKQPKQLSIQKREKCGTSTRWKCT